MGTYAAKRVENARQMPFAVAGPDVRGMAAGWQRAPAAPGLLGSDSGLVAWAERSGRRRGGGPARAGLRFAFYGRVSTEDWQDPVTSRARPRSRPPP
jgi:hypothetical protein